MKSRHVQKQWKCEICVHVFITKEGLRHHVERKHNTSLEAVCEFCGLIARSVQELANHNKECNIQFKKVRNKICKYFVRGGCLKGNECIFSHPEEETQAKSVQVCRNGPECRYLANGVCKFYHNEKESQKTRNKDAQNYSNGYFQRRPNVWCRFLEDCRRVPNCKFTHYEEDFPKLQQTNTRPLGVRSRVI